MSAWEHTQEKRVRTRTSSLLGQPSSQQSAVLTAVFLGSTLLSQGTQQCHCNGKSTSSRLSNLLPGHFTGPLSKDLMPPAQLGRKPKARACSRSVGRALTCPGGTPLQSLRTTLCFTATQHSLWVGWASRSLRWDRTCSGRPASPWEAPHPSPVYRYFQSQITSLWLHRMGRLLEKLPGHQTRETPAALPALPDSPSSSSVLSQMAFLLAFSLALAEE